MASFNGITFKELLQRSLIHPRRFIDFGDAGTTGINIGKQTEPEILIISNHISTKEVPLISLHESVTQGYYLANGCQRLLVNSVYKAENY